MLLQRQQPARCQIAVRNSGYVPLHLIANVMHYRGINSVDSCVTPDAWPEAATLSKPIKRHAISDIQ